MVSLNTSKAHGSFISLTLKHWVPSLLAPAPPHPPTSPTHLHSQANLRNAILERAVFTRSDLGGANVEGADFTNALLDKTQQMVRAQTQTLFYRG